MRNRKDEWFDSSAANREAKATLFQGGKAEHISLTAREIIDAYLRPGATLAWTDGKNTIVSRRLEPPPMMINDSGTIFAESALELSQEHADIFILVHGVVGIAAVDPNWNWQPIFTCSNPNCGLMHNVDELTFANLTARGAELSA